MINDISYIIINDNSIRTEKLTELIKELDINSEVIHSSEFNDCLDNIILSKPAVVFCDEVFGNKNVFDLDNELKKRNIRSKVYLIVVSDLDEYEHLTKYIDAGFDDYLIGHEKKQIIHNRIRLGTKILSMHLKIEHENYLLHKLSQQLEEDLKNIIKISTKFIQARLPASHEMMSNIAVTSIWIAEKFNQLSKQDIKDIEIASYFCQAGRLFLPDDLLKKPVMSNGRVLNPMMNQIPIVSKEIATSIDKFKNVGEILFHIYENLDGTGIPSKIQSWQIPLASRIIRAVLDFEENMYFNNLDAKSSIEKLKGRINRIYDGRVINLLEEYIEKQGKQNNYEEDFALLLSELKPSMIISREIKANSGMKLMNSGAELSEKNIQMLINHSSTDPILGYIYVFRDSIPEIKID